MNKRPETSALDHLEDLPVQDVDARDAGQVKGGFNPQPDPPKVAPIFQPPVFQPVFNPGGFVRP